MVRRTFRYGSRQNAASVAEVLQADADAATIDVHDTALFSSGGWVMASISVESLAVLRTISREPHRAFEGSQIMERIFASTMERPMDSPRICRSVVDLEGRSLITVVREGLVDTDYDFATVQVTPVGLTFINSR
jgi:hypothetical protein